MEIAGLSLAIIDTAVSCAATCSLNCKSTETMYSDRQVEAVCVGTH